MRKAVYLLVLTVFCILMVGCSDNLVKDSSKEPDIKVVNGVFDADIEKFISILNEDIEKENLPVVPDKYTSDTVEIDVNNKELGECTTYSCKVTETIEFRFASFKKLNGGISEVSVIGTGTPRMEKEDAKLLKRYYAILCDNVEPKFNVDDFNISFTSNEHFELGELFFWCGIFNTLSEDDEKQTLEGYQVTTNPDYSTGFSE